MYNNICCHYIRRCIIETNIFVIHERVFFIIRVMYNYIKYENVFLIIQNDV